MQALLFRIMTISQNDLEMIHQVAAGDEDALRALFTAYGQRMYAFALSLTRDPSIADDVVQDSLIAAWHAARRFRGEGRVLTWLLGIVHHKALNALRGITALGHPTPQEDEAADLPSREPLLDDQAIQQEQRRLLRDGLDCLPFEQRTVLELVFYQGLSLNEAADVCACPVGTIKSRLSYAKAALRGVLNRQGLTVEDVR
jgi:RNA polymerase sigma-70 factor (ECF subfamily)